VYWKVELVNFEQRILRGVDRIYRDINEFKIGFQFGAK
jgi:hypothetical protein